MEQPLHTLVRSSAAQASPRRALGVVVVVAIHVIVIWALITGLAQQMMQKLPSELMAKVEEAPPPVVKLPPPPPPDMVKPPPPFVPPPDITIQSDAPVTNTITTQSVVATPPPPVVKAAGPSSPVLSPGSGNNCASSYYPVIAVRLNQEGTVTVAIHVGADGSVTNVQVAESSGHDSLDEASIKCITARWHFKPAMENGVPVEGTKQMKVVWKLQG
jgi:periplasmic protein TonB